MSRLLVLILLGTLVVGTGCKETDPAWRMTLVGASPGGAWSAIGEAITDELRRGIPRSAFTLEPGQDGANASIVQARKAEMGLVLSSIALAALKGDFPFSTPHPDIRSIMLIYADAPFHFIVDQRSGVQSFEQIRAQRLPLRISVNTRGSLMELATRTVLEAYSIGYDDIREVGGTILFYPFTPSYEAMKRRRLDAIGTTVQVPSRHAIEASRNLELNILPLSKEAIDFANQRLGTDTATILGNSYPFMEEDIPTFAGRVILTVQSNLPDQQVYLITQLLHDRLEQLRRAHRSLQRLTPTTMPLVGGVPLHPGAERFYREIGVL